MSPVVGPKVLLAVDESQEGSVSQLQIRAILKCNHTVLVIHEFRVAIKVVIPITQQPLDAEQAFEIVPNSKFVSSSDTTMNLYRLFAYKSRGLGDHDLCYGHAFFMVRDKFCGFSWS